MVNFMVCRASSRVGERMRARAPVWALRVLSLSNMGMRKQAVLPLPVRAMATTSLPSRITGMVCRGMSGGGEGSAPAPKHHMIQSFKCAGSGQTRASQRKGWGLCPSPDPTLAKACLHTSGDEQPVTPNSFYCWNNLLQVKPDSISPSSHPPQDPRETLSPSWLNV